MIEGFFPNVMVVFRVPVESCRGQAGDREPLGLDLGEFCSGLRTTSDIMFIIILDNLVHTVTARGWDP